MVHAVSQIRTAVIERRPRGSRHRKRADRPAIGRVLQARIPDHRSIDHHERLANVLFRVFGLLVGISGRRRRALVRVKPARDGKACGEHGNYQGRQRGPPRQLRRSWGGRRILGMCPGRRLGGRRCGFRLDRRFGGMCRGRRLSGRSVRHWSIVSFAPRGSASRTQSPARRCVRPSHSATSAGNKPRYHSYLHARPLRTKTLGSVEMTAQ